MFQAVFYNPLHGHCRRSWARRRSSVARCEQRPGGSGPSHWDPYEWIEAAKPGKLREFDCTGGPWLVRYFKLHVPFHFNQTTLN